LQILSKLPRPPSTPHLQTENCEPRTENREPK
jgi:hypothetical protein